MKRALHPKRVRHTVRHNKVVDREREYLNHRDSSRKSVYQKVRKHSLSNKFVYPRQRVR